MRWLGLIALLSTAAYATGVAPAGEVDRWPIVRVIKKRMKRIRACYEKELETKPTLEGHVTVDFRIEMTGKVSKAKATGVDPQLDQCIETQFRLLVFPTSTSPIELRYPFVFNRGG
jgi:hypothetical protein